MLHASALAVPTHITHRRTVLLQRVVQVLATPTISFVRAPTHTAAVEVHVLTTHHLHHPALPIVDANVPRHISEIQQRWEVPI